MGVILINDNYGNEIRNSCQRLSNELLLMSPFMSDKECDYLSQIINNKNISCRIITRFSPHDFLNNASSLVGLKKLLNARAEILALNNLHSKLYIFDQNIAILGSANFTQGGFSRNHELGIKIMSPDVLLKDTIGYFDRLWNDILEYNIVNSNEAKITHIKINTEIDNILLFKKNNSNNYNKYKSEDKGAKIKIINRSDPNNLYYLTGVFNGIKIEARLLFINKTYIVLKNSKARKNVVKTFRYGHKRDRYIANGSMVLKNNYYIFKKDTIFSSSSAAASIVLGASKSGKSWKNKYGKLLK